MFGGTVNCKFTIAHAMNKITASLFCLNQVACGRIHQGHERFSDDRLKEDKGFIVFDCSFTVFFAR